MTKGKGKGKGKEKEKKTVFRPDEARRLAEGKKDGLTDDGRALLLALAEVEAANLGTEDREALDKLKEKLKGYDAEDLTRAVQHMITAKPVEERKTEWPELKRRRRAQQTSKKKKK